MAGPDIRRALSDHVENDRGDAAADVAKKAAAFADASLDLGELIALSELNKALAAARAERTGKETAPPTDMGSAGDGSGKSASAPSRI